MGTHELGILITRSILIDFLHITPACFKGVFQTRGDNSLSWFTVLERGRKSTNNLLFLSARKMVQNMRECTPNSLKSKSTCTTLCRCSTDCLKCHPMPDKKCGNLRYDITYNVIFANQKTESFEYHWLSALAMFDVTRFPAILSCIGRHLMFCRYVNCAHV